MPFWVYLHLVRAQIRSQLQYRGSFLLDATGTFFITAVDFVAILAIFHNVPALAGWTKGEIALLYAMTWLAFGTADMLVGHLDRLPNVVRDGSFDLVLIRPRGTLLQMFASDFELRRIGHVLQSLLILAYALTLVDVAWDPVRVAMIPLTVITGVVIFSAVWVTVICIVFWVVEGRETANAFTYGGQFFSTFPISVYDRWLRRVLGYAFGMAFVAYLPCSYILGKDDTGLYPAWLPFASPLVAAAGCVVAGCTWRFAIRHYRSAGG